MADAQQMTMRALEAMVPVAWERGDGEQSDMTYLLGAAAVVECVESLLAITTAGVQEGNGKGGGKQTAWGKGGNTQVHGVDAEERPPFSGRGVPVPIGIKLYGRNFRHRLGRVLSGGI